MSDRPRQLEWKRLWVVLPATIFLLHFLIVGFGVLLGNTNSDGGDQGSFLSLGLDIREGRALTDGNRNPLFALFIAPFARREWSYFTVAKLISLAAGVAALITLLIGGAKLEGLPISLTAMALLSLNYHFLIQSPRVLCESLLVWMSFAAWCASVRALERPTSWKAGAIAGALAGGVYLTKGTGNLTIIAFVMSAILVHRRRVLRSTGLWAFLAVLLIVVSPLLVYNWVQYRNPLYNYNSVHAMWYDDWDEHYQLEAQRATLSTYLETHSLPQMLGRQMRGMIDILPIIAEGFRLGGIVGTGWLFTALAAALAVWGLWTSLSSKGPDQPHGPRVVLMGWTLLLFYLFFSWYAPVTDAPRFFLPVAAIVYLMGSRTVVMVAKRLANKMEWTWFQEFRRRRHLASWVLAGLEVWCLLGVVQAWKQVPWENPFVRDARENRDAGAVIEWLDWKAGNELQVLWGPSHSLPTWKSLTQVHYEAIPYAAKSWPDLERFIESQGFHYVVLDGKMYRKRRKALTTYLDKNVNEILFRSFPPGWTFAHAQRGQKENWYVIALESTHPTPVRDLPTPVLFGDAILLRGYAIHPSEIESGDLFEVVLLWEALQPISQDLTVFVHLLDAQGQRHAQADSYPLGGMHPTSMWKAGESIRDPRTIFLPHDIPPGRYRLIVGWYDLGTGKRLPIAGTGRGIGQDGSFELPEAVTVASE